MPEGIKLVFGIRVTTEDNRKHLLCFKWDQIRPWKGRPPARCGVGLRKFLAVAMPGLAIPALLSSCYVI